MSWKPLNEHPESPCGVLLWFPLQAHDRMPYGSDYRVQIGTWNGSAWLEQGTNHEVLSEAITMGDERAIPTMWCTLQDPPHD